MNIIKRCIENKRELTVQACEKLYELDMNIGYKLRFKELSYLGTWCYTNNDFLVLVQESYTNALTSFKRHRRIVNEN